MTTIYDAVDVSAIPASATTILAYIDGGYQTYNAVKARFPNARVLTVTTNGHNHADICDVESGDASPATAGSGVRAGLYPTVYSDKSTKPALDAALSGTSWLWYAADPTGVPHLVPNSVATQYAWPGYGSPGNYDISITNGVYPNAPAPTPPAPTPGGSTMAVSAAITFKSGQIDVFQVSEGTLWHKWCIAGVWKNESIAMPAGIAAVTGSPQTSVIGGACYITVEDTAGKVVCLMQTSTGSTWNEAALS